MYYRVKLDLLDLQDLVVVGDLGYETGFDLQQSFSDAKLLTEQSKSVCNAFLQGKTGNPGPSGPAGAQGNQGLSGPQGEKGRPGARGKPVSSLQLTKRIGFVPTSHSGYTTTKHCILYFTKRIWNDCP